MGKNGLFVIKMILLYMGVEAVWNLVGQTT